MKLENSEAWRSWACRSSVYLAVKAQKQGEVPLRPSSVLWHPIPKFYIWWDLVCVLSLTKLPCRTVISIPAWPSSMSVWVHRSFIGFTNHLTSSYNKNHPTLVQNWIRTLSQALLLFDVNIIDFMMWFIDLAAPSIGMAAVVQALHAIKTCARG